MKKLILTDLAKHWTGTLDLRYTLDQATTKLTKALAQAPLKIQRAFYPEGPELCHSVLLHTAGGMVGGDRLIQTIQLDTDAQVLLTTAAASKVYKSQGDITQQNIEIQLANGAYLEWLPQETVIFNDAIYQQTMRVDLGENACFCGWEMTRLGRTARGEQFLSGDWRSRLEIWQGGQPLWIDRQCLPGGTDLLHSPNGLNGKAIVATLLWIGQAVDPETLSQARQLGQELVTEGEIGLTQTQGSGLVCRYRGSSTEEVKHYFWTIWSLLRQTYRDRAPIKPRVWLT